MERTTSPGPITLRVKPPAVVIETAFLSAGLPADRHGEAIERIVSAIRDAGSAPAFAGVIGGEPIIGLERAELDVLAESGSKASARDLGRLVSERASAGTTVAATLFLAHRAGLPVAATGGIGGVHPEPGPPDVSADLMELWRRPVILVCSGVKAFLDGPATLERLETLGVTVVGFGTDRMPAFWTADAGRVVPEASDADAVISIWRAARRLGAAGGLLVAVPPPPEKALAPAESERAIGRALNDLESEGITGPSVTPFLLARIAAYTAGRSVEANLALLERNASVGGLIAAALAEG